ncbi:MAG: class I SAM-dependent methyltransferase [Nitrospira sp.]|nr:class I SAM-dependent methyltransferase [Nitrospira sp.]MCP9442107.1 class I SAM-dependent methyltransferase [Nitrospira sp.]
MTTPFVTSCPAGCDADFHPSDIAMPEGRLLACAACGHLVSQIGEIDYLAAVAKFDTDIGTLPDQRSQRRHDQRARRLFARIRALLGLPPGSPFRLLDVGCSSGALLLSARKEGIEAVGVEPARRAAEAARAAGLTVFHGTLHEARYPAGRFHAVTMMEVIEHLRQPIDVVREIWNILGPNGILVVGTGNIDSWTVSIMRERWDYFHMERYGGHISFFTPRSLEQLAGRCGFRIERLETRRVRFVESFQTSFFLYRTLKIVAEVLNAPAMWCRKGHDMLAFLRKV